MYVFMVRGKICNEDIYICKLLWSAEDIPVTISKNFHFQKYEYTHAIIKCTKKCIIRKKKRNTELENYL